MPSTCTPYRDDTALIDAYLAGEIQAMTTVSREALPEIAALPGMRLTHRLKLQLRAVVV